MVTGELIDITVVLAEPRRQQVIELSVAAGTTARDAVALAMAQGLKAAAGSGAKSGDAASGPSNDLMHLPIGVFGEVVADEQVLVSGDRVELYRPLQQDPMELRRRRASRGG